MNLLKSILKNTQGAAMVEFTIIMMVLLTLTFGIIDFGNLLWQWNSAEKATQVGARAAVISDPVVSELATFDCDNGSISLGTPCRDPAASTFGTITCDGGTSPSCTCTVNIGGCSPSGAAFSLIFAPMQQVYPRLQPENVIVEYIDVGLGFAGRQAPVPEVRVRLTGLTFDYIFIGPLLGFTNIAMPDFRATLVGEDLSSSGA